MKPLSRLEALIAEIVERPAWLLASRKLHPLELTTALTRALEERAVRLADRVIAPDDYELRLNPADFAAFADSRPVLERELAEHLARTVADHDLTCNRPPEVRLLVDDTVRAGKIAASARFGRQQAPADTIALPPTRRAADFGHDHPEVLAYGHGAPALAARRPASGGTVAGACLWLLGPGGEPAHRYALDGAATVIGRRNGAAVPLLDTKVSREHARIERRDGGYALSDLNSLNGTLVNGERVQGARRLRNGDVIQIGHFRLRFADGEAS